MIRFGSGTPSITGERAPCFVALQNPHPMRYAVAGLDAVVIGTLARKPHVRRVRLALALAAHADPALDALFPRLGPCGFCGPQFDQRHRVIDAIAGRLEGGEGREEAAGDYGLPVAAVDVIAAWAKRWPGAWG